jgi:xylan 1,4-beta-xylosidase
VPDLCRRPLYLIYGRETVWPGVGRSTANASLRFPNYLVTAGRIGGDWSELPEQHGFDPSLFHDEDGRKYLLNMLWDHRAGQNRLPALCLECSPRERS